MSAPETLSPLESVHQNIGILLKAGNRLLTCVLTLGAIFCLLAYLLLGLIRQPEHALHLQAFMFNYSEMANTETPPDSTTAKAPATETMKAFHDPDWDGVIAGASMGLSLGRNIPVIGIFCGPVLGAVIGYQLDSRL